MGLFLPLLGIRSFLVSVSFRSATSVPSISPFRSFDFTVVKSATWLCSGLCNAVVTVFVLFAFPLFSSDIAAQRAAVWPLRCLDIYRRTHSPLVEQPGPEGSDLLLYEATVFSGISPQLPSPTLSRDYGISRVVGWLAFRDLLMLMTMNAHSTSWRY